MKEIIDMLTSVNNTMEGFGYKQKLVVGNDYIKISEKEVIINMPFTLTLKIPKEKFGNENNIKDVVSQAMNQAVSHPVSQSR